MDVAIRCFVIEDSPLQQKRCQSLLERIFQEEYAIELTMMNVTNLKEFYETIPYQTFYPTDFFVIDYELFSYFNGIDVAKRIKEYHPEAIISLLTAFSDQAITAINSGIAPVAYITKEADAHLMLANLKYLAQRIVSTLQLFTKHNQHLKLTIGTKKKLISCHKICYLSTIKMERNRIFIETLEEQLVASSSWKEIKRLLADNKNFVTFKSYIFNLEQIDQYSRVEKFIHFKNDTTLYLGTKILDRLIKEIERKQS